MYCKECGKEITEKDGICNHCQMSVKPKAKSIWKAKKNLCVIIGICLTILVVVAIVLLSNSGNDLVGKWVYETNDVRAEYTFYDDETFYYYVAFKGYGKEQPDWAEGHYTVNGDTLTMTSVDGSSGPKTEQLSFHVQDDALTLVWNNKDKSTVQFKKVTPISDP